MMTAFFLRGLNEYKRQNELQKAFQAHSEQIDSVLRRIDTRKARGFSLDADEYHHLTLLALMPLVEIAWADGRVSRREMDVIVQAADAYGLVDHPAGYRELMERLISRPAPQTVGRMWQHFHNFLGELSGEQRATIIASLTAQAEFIAEQSSDSLIHFLRGERICEDEQNALRLLLEQLDKARGAAEDAEAAQVQTAGGDAAKQARYEDFENLIPIVPLVKTAWAEGRITKRERHLILEAAARYGIKPNTASYRRLSDWLELHPTDEFYEYALDRLAESWQSLDADEKRKRKFDLLSDCTRIAEASGGSKSFPAGGMKICDEEIAAVKRIAKKINSVDAV